MIDHQEEPHATTAQIDDILSEKLERAFHQQTSTVVLHDIAKIACEHSSIDLAYAASRLPPTARHLLYDNFASIKDKIAFMIHTDSGTRLAVFRHISDVEVKKLIEHMPPDEAVFVLEDISERRFRRILELLDVKKAMRIREIKKHPRNTAGRLMTNEFFAFSKEVTIGEAALHIRNNPGIDLTRRIFVLGLEGELQGYVPARNFIVNPDSLPLRQVMRPILHKVSADAGREEVVDLVQRYGISALPVVDEKDRLIGVITYEDVLEAIEDITDETLASVGGVAEKIRAHEPFWRRLFSRAPWLAFTLCAGLINVGVISSFQSYEGSILTFMLFFVPLITGMSGNIGLQCSTVLVRGMALGAPSLISKKDTVRRELVTGVSIGCLFGFFCGALVYLLDFLPTVDRIALGPLAVGVVVGSGLTGACLAGTLLGVFSPLFFSRIGIDPAIASGPIVTALNDLLSMSIYLLIASGLISLFL